jgi:hypothetical protein
VRVAFERNFRQFSYCELAYINILGVSVYEPYISQLIRHSRASGSYHYFIDRGMLLSRQLLNQCFRVVNLKSSLRKFCFRHHDLVNRYIISVSQMTKDMLRLSYLQSGPLLIHGLSFWICNKSNTTGVTSGFRGV